MIEKIHMKVFKEKTKRFSIEHLSMKYIQIRQVMLPRIHGEISSIFDKKLDEFVYNWDGTANELSDFFLNRVSINSLTMHPTEGRTIKSIKL